MCFVKAFVEISVRQILLLFLSSPEISVRVICCCCWLVGWFSVSKWFIYNFLNMLSSYLTVGELSKPMSDWSSECIEFLCVLLTWAQPHIEPTKWQTFPRWCFKRRQSSLRWGGLSANDWAEWIETINCIFLLRIPEIFYLQRPLSQRLTPSHCHA